MSILTIFNAIWVKFEQNYFYFEKFLEMSGSRRENKLLLILLAVCYFCLFCLHKMCEIDQFNVVFIFLKVLSIFQWQYFSVTRWIQPGERPISSPSYCSMFWTCSICSPYKSRCWCHLSCWWFQHWTGWFGLFGDYECGKSLRCMDQSTKCGGQRWNDLRETGQYLHTKLHEDNLSRRKEAGLHYVSKWEM